MSYRTIKKVLGETSLERKCRFLLGGGLMLLITASFYFYARVNERLVYNQNKTTARLLTSRVLLEAHWKEQALKKEHADRSSGADSELFAEIAKLEKAAHSLNPPDLREYSASLHTARLSKPDASRPFDYEGDKALARLEEGEDEVIDIDYKNGEYNYYGPVHASRSCLDCHHHAGLDLQAGDLMGMVKVTLPLEKTEKAMATNNAVLWTMAIITTSLAMAAAWMIVRYVIVKPVLHLKNVSDGIARGTLDLRADIRTGDEFEELSHAFNRMLRHLTTVQDELREVNTNLDAKVDELAQVNLRLYEMNKLKDEFLATMSHELRTPLNSILGFSDVLAGSDNLTDKQKRYVNNIQTAGRNLMVLITDLLDLAKIESGRMELQLVEFAVDELVERQVNSMLPMAEKKNIDLTYRVEPAMPPVFQDPGKLQQILNNLLSNAIKFTPEGGRVRVRAEQQEDGILQLVVEDTGIGIPLEDQETIFEKFRQGKSIPGQQDTMTRRYGGTGLGLSIVKELSKLLGGEVRLESEFGKGSTFTVRVPIHLTQVRRTDRDVFEQTRADLEGHPVRRQPAEATAPAGSAAEGNSHDESAA